MQDPSHVSVCSIRNFTNTFIIALSFSPSHHYYLPIVGIHNADYANDITMEQTLKRKLSIEGLEDNDTFNKKQKLKLPRKECITCCNEVSINRFPKLPHKSAQQHNRDVCFNCWEQHLASEIQSKGPDSVCCPMCEEVLEGTEIKKLADSKGYAT